jgi:hypothetical protein
VSAFTEYLIERGLRERSERERDPALRGLLFMIAQLAERVAGEQYTPDADVRSYFQQQWRTDLFKFRAFKFAIGKLLDALEEPPGEIRPAMTEEQAEDVNKFFGTSPEFMKLMVEIYKSPESLGAHQFASLWTQVVKSDLPFTEAERKMMLKHPILGRVMEREYYGFREARKALELEPEREDEWKAIERIMKDRNLSGEKDNLPPDLEEALSLINDRRGALLEKAKGLPPVEGLRLSRSEKLPTIDEALKLLKSKKPKDKRRD